MRGVAPPMRRSSSRPLLGGGAEGRSLLHLSRVSLCHSLPTAARRPNSWFKRSQPKTCLKTPTPTSWFAVPCASTSIASIRLPAQFWAEMTSRPRRAGLAVKLSDAQASGVNSSEHVGCSGGHHQRQRETLDMHAFKSNRGEQCAGCQGKMARSGPQGHLGNPQCR
jgi:hypothetical protein